MPVIFIALENSNAAELVMVRVTSLVAEPDPTAPVKVTAPAAAFTISVEAAPPVPSVVPLIVTPPEPAVKVIVAPLPSRKAPPPEERVMSELVVDILLESVVAPVVEKPPGAVMVPVTPLVKIPELVTAIAPPVAAVKLLLTL